MKGYAIHNAKLRWWLAIQPELDPLRSDPRSRNSKMSFSFLRSPGQTMHLALSSRFRDGH